MAEVLKGSIERVTFHNAETGFAVLRVQAAARRGLVTVVGHLANAVAGEYIEAAPDDQWRILFEGMKRDEQLAAGAFIGYARVDFPRVLDDAQALRKAFVRYAAAIGVSPGPTSSKVLAETAYLEAPCESETG